MRDRNVHTSARRLIIVIVLFFVLIGVLLYGPLTGVLERTCTKRSDAPSGNAELVWKWWPPSFKCEYVLPDGRRVVLPLG